MLIMDKLTALFYGTACAAIFLLGYGVWRFVRKPTRRELLLKKERLEYSIQHWQYPEGDYVPQHKRLPMMRELSRLSKKLDE